MKTLVDILLFRRMIAPVILQILFWGGIGGTLYGTWVLIELGNWAWPLALIFGVLGTRVIFEIAILSFRNYEQLRDIRASLGRNQE